MLYSMTANISSKKNCFLFALMALTVNTLFRNYVVFCCIIQFLAFIWCTYFVLTDHHKHRYQVISSAICLIILIVYSSKGLFVRSWTFFLKAYCLFDFVQYFDDNQTENILTDYAKVTLFSTIAILGVTLFANIFQENLSYLPSFFEPIQTNISESVLYENIDRYCGFLGHPNQTAMFFCISIMASAYLLKIKGYRIISAAVILISAYFIMIAKSRGSILTAMLFFMLFPIFFTFISYSSYSASAKRIINITIAVILVLLIVLGATLLISPKAFALMAEIFRFEIPEEPSVANKLSAILSSFVHGSGRDSLIDAEYDVFRQSPFTGAEYNELLESSGGLLVHNGFLFMLFLLGIPAFIVMMILLMVMSIIPAFRCMIHRRQYSSEERFQISFSIAALTACLFYNFFENAIGPLGNDPFSMLFLLSSGVLYRISHKAV